MKCRSCGYPLWNLREPRCPECGETFDATSWRFEPGAVRYGCPRCDHLFSEKEPGVGVIVCPVCGHTCNWSRVRVVRPVDGDEPSLRRQRDSIVGRIGTAAGVAAGLIAMFSALLIVPRQTTSNTIYPIPLLPLLGSMFLWFGGVVACCLAAVRSRRREWAVVCVLVGGLLGTVMFGHKLVQRRQYIAHEWHFQTWARMSSVYALGEDQLREDGSLPPSMLRRAIDCGWPIEDLFVAYGSATTAADIQIGDVPLSTYTRHGAATAEGEATSGMQNGARAWERVGDFVVCLDPRAWRMSGDVALIISVPSPHTGERSVIFAGRMGFGDIVDADSAWIDAQNSYRACVGLDPLPALP